jgi:uncharacterized membrane protein YhaH (DUF805 family)
MMNLSTAQIIIGICIPFVLLTFWAIFDAAQRDFGAIEKKAIWILIAAVPFVGFIVYLIFGLRRGKKSKPV